MLYCMFVTLYLFASIKKNCSIAIEFMYVFNVYLALVLKHDVPKLIQLLSILSANKELQTNNLKIGNTNTILVHEG